MGVTGLWNLIEDAGTRVNVDNLNQKILAIDLSIWIHQSIKGFRDKDGRAIENAHLLGLFYRICKLLFYQIKPIVVFDGDCPLMKLYTVNKRAEKRQKMLDRSKNLSLSVLQNYIRLQFRPDRTPSNLQNIFSSNQTNEPKKCDIYKKFVDSQDNDEPLSIEEDEPESEQKLKKGYDIHEIDINSDHFKNLPAITRYEILVELRESYKNRKSTNIDLLPQEANSFAQFQMNKLLKKRNLQEEIEKLINEFNGTIDQENMKLLKMDNAKKMDLFSSQSSTQINSGTLASDEKTRFLLLKTLNQALDEFNDDCDDFNCSNDDSCADITSNSQFFHVPNALPGQEKLETDDRINYLSQQSSDSSQTLLRQLSQKINNNYKQYSKNNDSNQENNLKLSDADDSSSTNSDDFIEVDSGQVFDESLPYDTSYEMDIFVDNQKEPVAIDSVEPSSTPIQDSKPTVDNVIDNRSIIELSSSPKENLQVTNVPAENNKKLVEDANVDKARIEKEMNIQCSSKQLMEQMISESKESTKFNRQATSLNDQMISECQELLRLFGIPWVVAPSEAEAQCACLEKLGLCEGVITDDSDVFLFGGQTVYRNFFNNSKYILRYQADDLKKYYGLDRSKLICMGMLCGTDYTLGIDGVGPVTAMEILTQFPGDGLQSLNSFAQWHKNKLSAPKNERPENSIRLKFLKLKLPTSFPSRIIYDAYSNANVDESTEPFSWSMPQLSELRLYALERFGWPEAKTDAFLLPVLKNLNAKQIQKKIDFYFKPMSQCCFEDSAVKEKLKIKRSKRLNEAIRKSIQTSIKQRNQENASKQQSKSKRRRKNKSFKSSDALSSSQVVLSEESSSDE